MHPLFIQYVMANVYKEWNEFVRIKSSVVLGLCVLMCKGVSSYDYITYSYITL